MGLLDELKPWKEIVWKNKLGQVVKTPCTCSNRIPGLDAEACLDCRIWWVDEYEREQHFKNKRRQRLLEDDAEISSKPDSSFVKTPSLFDLLEDELMMRLSSRYELD